jgi:two-component system sensor histidine kinase KdpD
MRWWHGRRSALALVGGVLGCTVVLAGLYPFNDRLDLTVPALALLVPVAAAGVAGGGAVAALVAVFAALGYAFGYVPPVGDIRVHLARDVVTLVTLVAVGATIGMLADRTRTREEHRRADERRTLLLRSVSHDLRNPLQTIRSITDDLLTGVSDDNHYARQLSVVAVETSRLDRIVANMLSASRIEAGELRPNLLPEHVASLVLSSTHRVTAATGRVILTEIDDDLPDVLADAVQFDQVLSNLLDNALRESGPRGTVVVSAEAQGSVVAVTVRDDGPGFGPAASDPGHPFRPGRSSTGAGLGLSICQAIVEAHGGQLAVGDTSTAGGVVTFTLPIA